MSNRPVVTILDTNFIGQLYEAGGREAWNTLLDVGDKLILTTDIQREIRDSSYGNEFQDWVTENNSKFEIREYRNLCERGCVFFF
jgi:hypothetical protein